MNPKVTILVPTFNRAHFIAECLDSLLNQTLAASQIIVVNDGSEDHTLSVVMPYMDRIEYYLARQDIRQGDSDSALSFIESLEKNYPDSLLFMRGSGRGRRWQPVTQVVSGLR